ncbi:MmpS family transport accessory protein [Streptomyces sp. NPDC085944]|uniref:MmpS family transport accessory protein n=1 Tax=Streptomyces sp. NPDC085944 TaxID=3154962 RepID=UPI003419E04D
MSAKDSAESTENTGSTEKPEDSDSSANPETPEVTATGGARTGVLIAAVLLLACAGLVGYGLLDTEDEPKPSTTPTAAVTYEVTGDGAAEISYLGPDEDGRATVVRDAELPWKHTVQVPLGETPTVAVVLGDKGGQAACTLAIRGKHVQRATAVGEFGRATCTGELPAAGT